MGFLQNPDPARKLARQYGIRGLFSPEIVPSLQPTVLIDDLTGGINNEPQRIAVSQGTVTGVAAEFSVFRFETPPGIIARITDVASVLESGTLLHVHFGSSVAAPATLHNKAFTDGRLREAGESPAAFLGSDTYAVAPTPTHFELPGNTSNSTFIYQKVNWVVGQTDAFDFLEFSGAVADKNIQMMVQWIEYSADRVR